MSETHHRLDGLTDEPLLSDAIGAVTGPYALVDADGRLVAWNDAFCETTGVDDDRLDGAAVAGVFEDESGVSSLLSAVTDSRETDSQRLRLDSEPDGEAHAVEVQATPLCAEDTCHGAALTLAAVDDGPHQTSEGGLGDDEEVYRAAVNAAPDSVYALRPDHTIAMFGNEFERYTGFSTAEVMGEDIAAMVGLGLVDEAEIGEAKAAFDRVLDGERNRESFETTVHLDDEERTVENRVAPIEQQGEITGVVVVVRDVTERTERERASQTAEERLSYALNSTNAGVFEWEVGAEEVYYHDALLDLYGFEGDSNYRSLQAFYEFVHPDDRDALVSEGEILEAGGLDIEFRIEHPERGTRWIASEGTVKYEDGEPDRIVGIERDVTERKEREQALETAKERLDYALTNTDAGVFETQVNGEETYFHESFADMLGIDVDDNLGTREQFLRRVHPNDRDKLVSDEEAVEAGNYRTEYRIVHPERGVRWIESEGVIRHEDGQPDRIIGVVRDITERKEREQTLETVKERLDFALANTDAGVYETPVQGEEVYYHDSLQDVLGLDVEGNYGTRQQFHDRVHPDDLDTLVTDEEVVEAGTYTDEYRIHHPERGLRWVSSEGFVKQEEGQPDRIIGMIRDVTERKEREQALETAKERLDYALTNTDAGVFETPVHGEEAYFHESLVDIFGVDVEDNPGTREQFLKRVHPDDRDKLVSDEEGVEAGSYRTEYRIQHPERGIRWIGSEAVLRYDDGEPDRFVGIVRDITERKEREQALETVKDRLDRALRNTDAGVFEASVQGEEVYAHNNLLELLGIEPGSDRDERRQFFERVHPDDREKILIGKDNPDPGQYRVEYRIQHPDRGIMWLVSEGVVRYDDGEPDYVTGVIRDVTERREREQTLRERRDELETLTGIQKLIQDTIGELAAAQTREEIQETVCDRLVDSEFYEFAWIGKRNQATRELEPVARAGDKDDYLDSVTVTADTSETGQGPGGRALRTSKVQTVDDMTEDLGRSEWRDAAREAGLHSLIAVPLTHGVATHGVLAVYASRSDRFTEREATAFQVLGEAVGFALSAARNRRLLESSDVIELKLQTRDDSLSFISLSKEEGVSFEIQSPVLTADGKVSYHLVTEGIDPERVMAVGRNASEVERVRRVDVSGNTAAFEFRIDETMFQSLAEVGARTHRAVFEDGVATVYVEVPPETDVRGLVATLREELPDLELETRTKRDRDEPTVWHRSGSPIENLTDRQEDVLRAAYFSGYYEWPRDTDSEALAETLDVASTTVLQHLRKGHRNVFAALFDS